MASAGQPTTSDDMSLDGDVEERQQSSWNMGGTSVAMARPTTLTTVIQSNTNVTRWNVDHISTTPSPLDTRPRIFRPGLLFSSNQVVTTTTSQDVHVQSNAGSPADAFHALLHDASPDDLEVLSEYVSSQTSSDNVSVALATDQLRQITDYQRVINSATGDDRPTSPENVPLETASTTNTQISRPYPPTNRTGPVDDHDRPFAKYGHLDRATIAKECDFHFQPPSSSTKSLDLYAKSFAITAWTNVSKESVLAHIKEEFGISKLQYICICEEVSPINHQRHIHVQIILKEKTRRRRPFLDEITGSACHYQVTNDDLAWNEYIKKDGNFVEFNTFKSTRTRGPIEWPTIQSPPASTSSRMPAATSRAVEAEQRRQEHKRLLGEAVLKAEENVDDAMNHIRTHMIDKFVERGTWYLQLFRYVHSQAQKHKNPRHSQVREFIWPRSFPNCTPRLREAVTYWIENQFPRTSRAQCLIIIGPTGTGKTSFSTSLPGDYNYFQVRFNLDRWNDNARYSVYDDIPWDEFEKRNFPDKRSLLTQQSRPIQMTDKYRPSKEIVVRQPAIVLLNPQCAGSLLTQPITEAEKQEASYWKERAFVYVMGPDEYFYQRPSGNHPPASTPSPTSRRFYLAPDEPRMGEPDEFEKMAREYDEQHPQ